MVLFCSVARGDEDLDSDLDLLVVFYRVDLADRGLSTTAMARRRFATTCGESAPPIRPQSRRSVPERLMPVGHGLSEHDQPTGRRGADATTLTRVGDTDLSTRHALSLPTTEGDIDYDELRKVGKCLWRRSTTWRRQFSPCSDA
ncbi:MAG: hypothetical protein ACRDRA_06380 [Pseudonocardiaceae bacterium]